MRPFLGKPAATAACPPAPRGPLDFAWMLGDVSLVVHRIEESYATASA